MKTREQSPPRRRRLERAALLAAIAAALLPCSLATSGPSDHSGPRLAGSSPVASGPVAGRPAPANRLAAASEDLDRLGSRLAASSPVAFGELAKNPALAEQLSTALAALDPERRATLESRLAEMPGWSGAPDALLATLTPAQRAGLRLMADDELRAAQARLDLRRIVAVLSLLDDEGLEPLGTDRARLARLGEALAAPGTRVTPDPALDALTEQLVGALPDRLGSRLGDLQVDAQQVAAYRGRVTHALAGAAADPRAGALRTQIDALDDAALALLESELPADRLAQLEQATALGRHAAVIDALDRAHGSAAIAGQREALGRGTLAAARVAELEAFRHAFSSALLEAEHPALAQEIESAQPGELLEWETAGRETSLPAITSAAGAIAIEIGPPGGRRPTPHGCGLTDIGCWVDSVKDKVASGFNALFGAVRGALDVINGWLAAARDAVTGAAQTLPQQAFDLLRAGFDALVRPAMEQFSPDRLADTLGLEGAFWENLPQAPEIPCPAIGEQIPFFGTVGDGDAAQKYANYLWVFEQVLDIIPDTEVSLSVEIPAKIAFGGVQYLGLCLEQAAAAVEGEQTEAYRAGVEQALEENLGGLDQANAALAALQSELGDLSRQVDAGLAATLELVTVREIEQDLAARGPLPVATFFLPAAVGGQLERAREIVERAIADNAAAGLDTGHAAERLALADEATSAGEYRAAYALLRLAYQDAVAGVGTEVSPL